MKYNFDEIIERRGTNSVKWDGVKNIWGRDDLLPMWVADMDFRTPPFVMDALRKRLEHEVLGYTFACEEWYNSILYMAARPSSVGYIPRDADICSGESFAGRLLPCNVSLIRGIR